MDRSSTWTVPLEGRMRPATRLRIVDLPAPFGPSRAVTPVPIPRVRSETATTSPYHLATPRRATTARRETRQLAHGGLARRLIGVHVQRFSHGAGTRRT